MTLSTRPLSYCSNVHPGLTVAEVEAGLDRFTLPVQTQIGRPLAAALVRRLGVDRARAREMAKALRKAGVLRLVRVEPDGRLRTL